MRARLARPDGRRRQAAPRTLTSARRRVFLDQAESAACRSPLYDDLWRRLADEPLVDPVVEGRLRWDTPLRLAGGLHYLVLAGRASWDDVPAALDGERDFLREFVSRQGVQTNEVQRSWILVPCFLAAAERAGAESVDLVELGPSAGLNLVWDRYRCRYDEGEWGPAGAPLALSGEERRPVPGALLARGLRVLSRVGIDRSPVDVTTEHGARLISCFVWPDQTWRLEQLEAAVAALREDPPPIVRGHVAEALPGVLARRGDADLTLVYATNVLGYLSVRSRDRVQAALADAGRLGPVAFVSTGAAAGDARTHQALRLQLWPGEGARESLADADFHGAWMAWL